MLTPEPPLPRSVLRAPPLSTGERLILVAVRAAREARAATPELRDAVCDHVRELKESGYPPERVLIVVKALLAEAGVRKTGPLADSGSAPLGPETEIVERVVAWCIEEYFPPATDRESGSQRALESVSEPKSSSQNWVNDREQDG